MSYTTEQLYDAATQEAENFDNLSSSELVADNAVKQKIDLANNPSQVGIMRLIVWVCSLIGMLVSQMFDLFKVEINELAQAAQDGSNEWLMEKCKAFQYGNNSLAVIDGKLLYQTDMPETKCIDAVALRRDRGLTICLVATRNGSGQLEKLPAGPSEDKLGAFRAYLQRFQLPGTNIMAASYNADLVKFSANIYFDGLLEPEGVKNATLDAVEAYLATLSDFTLDGLVEDEKLTDAIQANTSVKRLAMLSIDGRTATGVYANDNNLVGYQTLSGYAVLDRSNCVLTMIPS